MQISFLQLISHWLTGLGPRAAAVRWVHGHGCCLDAVDSAPGPGAGRRGLLLLRDADNTVAAWPAVRLLVDEQLTLTAEEALARLDEFQKAHQRCHAGRAQGCRGCTSPGGGPASDGRWVLDINHPTSIALMCCCCKAEGAATQRAGHRSAAGSAAPAGARPRRRFSWKQARTTNSLRVQTRGAMILPITFNTPTGILGRAVNEQMLQGVLTGLALCLIFYSMAQWYSLREPLFIQYALLTSGSLLYSLHFFGVGQQYLWGHSPWLTSHAVGLASLMAITGSFFVHEPGPGGAQPANRSCAACGGAPCSPWGWGWRLPFDLISLKGWPPSSASWARCPPCSGLPGAWRLYARAGDSIGTTLLIAWFVYGLGSAAIIGVINGALPVNFWTLHSFQISATLDMLLFMRAGLAHQRAAHQGATRQPAARCHALAGPHRPVDRPAQPPRHADRTIVSPRARPHENLLAVYVMDLDGFKPVNDQHGHDVGDELLVAVARRLQGHPAPV